MKQLDSMPEPIGRKPQASPQLKERLAAVAVSEANPRGLSLPQLRVLRALASARGPLSCTKISDKCGNKTDVVARRSLGLTDPEKRAAFEQSADGGKRLSLISLGLVTEEVLDIEGLQETAYHITDAGRQVVDALADLELPPLADSYLNEDGTRKPRTDTAKLRRKPSD